MSTSYILSPVTEELLQWGRESGVPVADDISEGRFPTMEEVGRVLTTLAGYTSRIQGSDDDFHGDVESLETIEFVGGHPDPDLNAVFGGWQIAPREFVSFKALTSRSGDRLFSLQGDPQLIVKIAQELTVPCGALVIYVADNPVPVFLITKTDPPIRQEPWF